MSIPCNILSLMLPRAGVRAHASATVCAGWLLLASSGVSFAAKDSMDGPPPCGSDGVCNLAVCSQDPDCPANVPQAEPAETHPDSALDDVIDCNATRERDIRAVAWNIVDDWSSFARIVEDATGKNLGNCIENRFARNGKVRCISEYNCNDKGCKLAHGPGLTQQIKIYQTFFDNIAGLPQPDRRACYAGLITHEFSHSCERYSDGPNSSAELREDAAFNYWKNRFAVTGTLDPNADCGFD